MWKRLRPRLIQAGMSLFMSVVILASVAMGEVELGGAHPLSQVLLEAGVQVESQEVTGWSLLATQALSWTELKHAAERAGQAFGLEGMEIEAREEEYARSVVLKGYLGAAWGRGEVSIIAQTLETEILGRSPESYLVIRISLPPQGNLARVESRVRWALSREGERAQVAVQIQGWIPGHLAPRDGERLTRELMGRLGIEGMSGYHPRFGPAIGGVNLEMAMDYLTQRQMTRVILATPRIWER